VLSASVVAIPVGADVVLWHRVTGRHVRIGAADAADLAHASPGLRERLARTGLLADPDPAALIACRSRLPLVRPDVAALWYPVPSQPTPGGHRWTSRPLSVDELAIWRAITDARTVRAVAAAAGVAVDTAVAFVRVLTDPDVQAVQLRDAVPHPRDPTLRRLVGPEPALVPRDTTAITAAGATSLTAYHLAIADGPTHFDDVETTVAHALGLPHPGLAGRRFGEALHDALAARRTRPFAGTVVEVGCGDGALAEAFSSRLDGVRYVRVDLSPDLLRTQAARAPGTIGVGGDAVALPFRDGSVDYVLSNEVIADLESARDDGRWTNVGAWRFIAEIARVLRPGGAGYVSEFAADGAPEEAVKLDHPEVSIDFAALAAVARRCGLVADVFPLPELLGMDLRARQLARVHHEGLRAMVRSTGGHLPARAWTPDTLADALPWPIEGLMWVPQTEPGAGPLVTRFVALLVHKPIPAG
jgi:SAM-dependent methyltransferase